MSATRVYSHNDWMVKRWDDFNGGEMKTPKSFCQFWRTVLVWCTLAKIPVFGKVFMAHLLEDKPDLVYASSPPKPRSKTITTLGRVLKTVFTPVGFVLQKLFRGLVTIIAAIDRHCKRNREVYSKIGYTLGVLYIGAVIAGFVVGLVLIGIELYEADLPWLMVLSIAGIALGTFTTLAILRERIINGIFAVAFPLFQMFNALWRAAVDAKHYVCPPMEIEGRGQERYV